MEQTEQAKESALSIKACPLYDSIGLSNPCSSTQVSVRVQACALPPDDHAARSPVDIVVALDVSGSMKGEKLRLCKETLGLLLHELRPKDNFGLITFSTEATIEIPTRKLNTGVLKDSAHAKIDALETRNTTNISGGIGLAIQQLQEVRSPNAVRAAFLLTDGHANQGVVGSRGIVDLVKGQLEADKKDRHPITIHTFGYGADHDQQLLRDISNASTGGTYYFVDKDVNVASAFGDALGGVLSVVAQNVSVDIGVPLSSRASGVEVTEVHHKNKVRRDEDGSWRVSLGDFYAEESRDIVFDVSLASTHLDASRCAGEVPITHAMISLSYLDTLRMVPASVEPPIVVSVTRPLSSGRSPVNAYVAVQSMRVRAIEAMEAAEAMACDDGDLSSARDMIHGAIRELNQNSYEAGAVSNPVVLQLRCDLNRVLDGFLDVQRYELYGRHRITQVAQTHELQRCNESDQTQVNPYRTASKSVRAARFAKGSTMVGSRMLP